MYPNPFYRNVPYRVPAIPPRIPPTPFRSPGLPTPGLFGGRAPGAGLPRFGFPGVGAPGVRFPGAGVPGANIPDAVAAGAAGATEAAAATAATAATATGVSSLLAPAKIEQFLQSTGQFMKTAQTYAPYVQQAVPMFKNIPALFRLYKGFQNAPNASGKSAPSRGRGRGRSRSGSDSPSEPPKPQKSTVDYTPKPSLPKIYQPE